MPERLFLIPASFFFDATPVCFRCLTQSLVCLRFIDSVHDNVQHHALDPAGYPEDATKESECVVAVCVHTFHPSAMSTLLMPTYHT